MKSQRNIPLAASTIVATQIAIGAFGLTMLATPAQANYEQKATEATNYIQSAFYDPKAKLYRPALPMKADALPYDFMWANGVQYSVLALATKYKPERYKPTLYNFTEGLQKYWDADAPIPGFDAYFSSKDGDDKYYDDNAWLVLDFVEAYDETKDKQFLNYAEATHKFVLSGRDEKLGGGIYWHQQSKKGKNTCVNAPAAASAMELYRVTGDATDLEEAKQLYAWTNRNLQDEDGLFWDNINLDGKVQETKWTYNTALMIRTNVKLWEATKDAKYLAEARRVSDASLAYWTRPGGTFADDAKFNNWLCEALIMTHEATGDIKYLNAVRRHADFGYRQGRDLRDGGYWNNWSAKTHAPDERKLMIENAAAARIFWLLAPYDDVEELQLKGVQALQNGDAMNAANYLQQALNSTASALPSPLPAVPSEPVVAVSVPTPQTWKMTTKAPPANWNQPNFNDANWQTAPGAFGGKMDGGPEITTPWETSDIWLRRKFNPGNLSKADIEQLVLRQYHDDGIEIYINGVLAYKDGGATHEYANVPMSDAAKAAIKPGAENTLAVHCHDGGGDKHVDVGIYQLMPVM